MIAAGGILLMMALLIMLVIFAWPAYWDLRLPFLRPRRSPEDKRSRCCQNGAPPGARRLRCRERLPPEPAPFFLLHAHDL